MPSVKDSIKEYLFRYPDIYPTPLSIIISLFLDHQWKNGEIRSEIDSTSPLEMSNKGGSSSRLEASAVKVHRKWVADNIDDILNCSPLLFYFHPEWTYNQQVADIPLSCAGLEPPDDIKEDWKEALLVFLEWWLCRLTHIYGCSIKDKDFWRFWPKPVVEGRNKIIQVIEKLDPGHFTKYDDIIKEIIDEIIKEKHDKV